MIVAGILGLTAPPIILLLAAFVRREMRLMREDEAYEEQRDRQLSRAWEWDADQDLGDIR